MDDTNSLPSRPSGGVLDSLYRIGVLVNKTEDPREALDVILDEAVRVLGASSASIALLSPDSGCLDIEVCRGHESTAADVQLRMGQGITGWVALHARTLRVADVLADNRYFAIKPSVRSELAVPMKMSGQVIGVINCDSDRVNAFTAEDQSLLELLSNEAVKTVGRLWLMRQLKTKAAQMEALLATAQSFVYERDQAGVIADLASHACRLTGCCVAAVYSLAPDDGGDVANVRQLVLGHVAGELPGSRFAPKVACNETALGVTVSRRRQVEIYAAGRSEDSLFERLTAESANASLLATPIVYDNETLGVLLIMHATAHRFSDDEKRLLFTIASIGASALQNARLYARVFASEASLSRGERLTALGLLAAEIAHEVRNPLTVIKLLFDTLDLRFAPGDARETDLTIIREKITHLEEIVARVLNFGKDQSGEFARADLGDIIHEVLLLMRYKFDQSHVRVALTQDDPADKCHIEADKGQVQQVLINLFLNAIHAMPSGGNLDMRLWRETHAGAARVCLRIADTGSGIPAEMRDKIFESFFTGRKEGSGLGLAIAKRIMRSHHGDIVLEPARDTGATFLLTFPADSSPKCVPSPPTQV